MALVNIPGLVAVSRSVLRAISLWAAACILHDVLHSIVRLAVRNTYTNVFSAVH